MGITRPTGEQLRFRSQFTGDHVLDTYLEASEKGNRQLSDLLDDLFDSSGTFRADNFEFRFDEATDKIQFRAGNFASSTAGWTDITTFFKITGTFNSSTTYNNFDLITLSTKDIYIVHGLSSGTTFSDEAAVIASSNTDKLVDVSEARDWAKKTDGIVDSTDYSSKAWAIGGTGVTNSATGGAAKEWATKTSGTVDGTNFSAKYWATSTDVVTVSTNIASVNSVASAISNVNTVSTNISNVNTTASSIADVNTVAAELGSGQDVTVVAASIANVGTVASDISNVNTAAGSIANVNTVAGSITNVNTVSGSIANVNTTATNIADVNTVATEINNNNLQTVAADIQAVIDVADDLNEATSEIEVVANNIANVNTVGTNIANVNTVAGISSDVTTAATNSVQFNNTYLGAQSSAPTQDPDGSSLDLGDLYFDTTTSTMKVYSASGWINAGSSVNGTADRFTYTATASQTTFSGNDDNTNSLAYDAGFLDVYMNGVKLVNGSDFTATNGTSIVLASAAALNDTIEIIAYGTFVLADHLTETQSDAKYVELAGDTMTGDLTIGGNATVGTNTAGILNVKGGNSTSPQVRFFDGGTGRARIGVPTGQTYLSLSGSDTLTADAAIDASGNFLVGKTSPSSTSTGAELRPTGQAILVADGTNPILMNRQTSDGDIAVFRKDGTTVGTIRSSYGNRITIGTGDTGMMFRTSSRSIDPADTTTGLITNNVISLGRDGVAFRDLYLAGSAKLGVSGTTPAWVGSTSTVVADNLFGFQGGSYSNACYNISVDNNYTYFLHNAYYGSGGWTQRLTGYNPTKLQAGTDGFFFARAASTGSDTTISWTTLASFKADTAVFNEGGNDIDFRIESDNDANFFVADADSGDLGSIGIHTNSPSTDLDIVGGMRSRYRLTNSPGSQTGGVNDNYWKFGTLTLGAVAAAEITIYGTASYSSGYSIAGKTTIVLRGGTSSTNLDGTWWYEGEFTSGQVKDCVYVPTGTANEFDIYVKFGNYQCFDHEVVTGGKWVSAITNTGSSSPPSGSQTFSREYSIWNGDNNFWYWDVNNGTGNVFNENGANIDFRVESDASSYAFFLDASANVINIGQSSAVITSPNAYFAEIGQAGFHMAVANTSTSSTSSPLYLNRHSSDGRIITLRRANSTVGSIDVSTSGTTYNTTSDRRLKTDIQPIADATDKLMAMNPVTHKWKLDPDGDAVVGFIAQEMQEIVPEAVSGEPEGDEMMSMDYGRITPVLVAALQDAMKEITALKERVAELEAK